MCGIVCSWGYTYEQNENGLKAISHRGPDGQGIVSHSLYENKILNLGHVRLSILDLDERSNQPFSLDNERILCFNGEIYNHAELSKKYLKNITYVTESDTEILWLLLKHYGIDILGELMGMFAFIYFDRMANELIACRDTLGIKPMYFHVNDEGDHIFASEIKVFKSFGIKLNVESDDISEYLKFGYVNEPNTGFSNIKKIRPGEILRFDFNSKVWSSDLIKIKGGDSDIYSRIKESLLLHQKADVKQSLFYSGGIDSSLLLGAMDRSVIRPIVFSSSVNHVKSAGFSNDSVYARRILSELNQEFTDISSNLDKSDFIQDLKFIVQGVEELIADYTFIASHTLCAEVKERGFTVAHSGMGADEMFGGYPRYVAFKIINSFPMILKALSPIIGFLGSKKSGRMVSAIRAREVWNRYFALICVYDSSELSDLLSDEKLDRLESRCQYIWNRAESETPLKTAIKSDFLGFLSHNFIVADKSSMLSSVEVRVPLVTQSIYDWFLLAKDVELIDGFTTKPVLRKKLFKTINRKFFQRKKAGFNPPIDKKLDGLGRLKILKIIEGSELRSYINIDAAKEIVNNHFNNKRNNTYKIYNLLFLAMWLDEHSN